MQDIRSKVVSVLDILRAYAEAYCKGTLALSLATTTISEETRNGKPASFSLLQALRYPIQLPSSKSKTKTYNSYCNSS